MENPERIYAKVHGASTDVISGKRGLIGGWREHPRDDHIEYVRNDISTTALAARIAELEKALHLAEQMMKKSSLCEIERLSEGLSVIRRALKGGENG